MATPKIDRILTAFYDRIGDPAVFTDSVLQNGNLLTASLGMSFVNMALHELFNKYWQAVQNDPSPQERFIKIFPELFVYRAVNFTFSTYTTYAIANPNLDYYQIVDAVHGSVYITALPAILFNKVFTNKLVHYRPTDAKPAIIDKEKTLYLFPSSYNGAGGATGVSIGFIKLPVNPTTGAFLTQNGSYDSPYYDHWNDEIVRTTENLYKQARQRDL